MLFAQQNGLEAPVEDSTEVGVVQRIACGFGPDVDGIAASRSLPQSMGAFVTAGAQGACAGRGQQSEQHGPTTMHLGQTMTAAPTSTSAPTSPIGTKLPTTFVSKLSLIDRGLISPIGTKLVATSKEPTAPTAPVAPTPGAEAGTFPPGTITAFSSSTNMWRVAVPTVTAYGLGIFGATPEFTEVASVPAPPAGATQVPEKVLVAKTGQLPFYKKPLFWAIVAGSTVVLVGGGVLILRRRRKTTPTAPKAAYY
jgi:hypothetical protein